jgi:hypothetical protein
MTRWLVGFVSAALLTSAGVAHAQETPPAVLVWAHSLNAVASQSKALLEQIGLGPTADLLGGLIKAKLGPKGIAGLDGTRPIGAFLRFDPDPSGALVLPIAQEKDFFAWLDQLAIKSTKEKDGTYRLTFPLPIPVYAKITESHAWITILNKDGFAAKIDPNQVFPQSPDLLSARLRLDLIPKDARQIAISQFEDRLQQALKKNPPAETAAQRAFAEACNQGVTRLVAQVLQEGKEMSFAAAFDPAAKRLHMRLNLTPQLDTPLAKTLSDAGRRPSVFGEAPPDSALAGRLNLAVPSPVAKSLVNVIEEGYLEGTLALRDADKKKKSREFLDALKPSLEAGEIDALFRLVGPSADQKIGAAIGVKIQGSHQLGNHFKTLATEAKKQLPEADQAKVMLDADAVGAVSIHRLVLPTARGPLPDIFGESTLSLAFRPDAVVVGIGRDSLGAVKLLAAAKGGAAPLAQIKIDVAQLSSIMEPALRDAARSMFAKSGDGVCQIDVTGGSQLSVEVSVRTPVIRYWGQRRE